MCRIHGAYSIVKVLTDYTLLMRAVNFLVWSNFDSLFKAAKMQLCTTCVQDVGAPLVMIGCVNGYHNYDTGLFHTGFSVSFFKHLLDSIVTRCGTGGVAIEKYQ